MRKLVLISSVLIFYCFPILSQEHQFDDSTLLEDFSKTRSQFDDELKAFKEKADNEMAEFKSEADRAFADYLKNNWFRYNLTKADSFFIIKPVKEAPKYNNKAITSETINSTSVKSSAEKHENIVNLQPSTATSQKVSNTAVFEFYGNSIIINYDEDLIPNIPAPFDEASISKSWAAIVTSHYEKVINQLITYKINLSLNDFAFLSLIRKFSSDVTFDHSNANILSWVLLNKSGFKAKIGYSNYIYLLVPFHQMVYNSTYILFDNERYYLLENTNSSLKTYLKEDKDARLIMDLNVTNNMRFGEDYTEKEYSVGSLPALKLSINKNMIDFYATYPQTEINVYLDAIVNEHLMGQLQTYFKPLLSGKKDLEAINLILGFCQKLTSYKEDFESFGKEKFMFAEESFFYGFSDCEDRTVLFARLLHELTAKYSIGLQYKGHMACAVEVNPSEAEGAFVDNKYLVCDPTYIDAPAGNIIPECEGQNPVLILPDTNLVSESKRIQVAEFLKNHGIAILNNQNSLVFDETGNCYFTGSFHNYLKIGRYEFKSFYDSSNAVIGKIDRKKNVIWCNKISGKGNNKGYCIDLIHGSEMVFAFLFSDSVKIGNFKFYSQSKEYCIAKTDLNGNYKWVTPVITQNSNLSGSDYLQCSVMPDGKLSWVKPENNSLIEQTHKLYFSDNSIIFMAPSDKVRFDSNNLNYSSFDLFELPGQIISEYKRLVKTNIDSTAATIYAIGNLLQKNGSIMSGRAFQAALNKETPTFRNKNPLFYNALCNILLIRNNNNKIVISTKEKEKIKLNKLIIDDGAEFSMIFLPNGNLRVDVYRGIKALVFDVNYAVISKQEGTILFDFSKDHQQKALKIKPEIVQ